MARVLPERRWFNDITEANITPTRATSFPLRLESRNIQARFARSGPHQNNGICKRRRFYRGFRSTIVAYSDDVTARVTPPFSIGIVLTPLETLKAGVRRQVSAEAPEMLTALEDYLGEATFGAAIIAPHLETLPAGASILEVGAGSRLLSCALQHAGFRVTALEPVAEGFSHLDRFRRIVVAIAAEGGAVPAELQMPAEDLAIECRFDFAFSINVMEHVSSVDLVLDRVLRALRPECGYRFVCPNYLFPYEPHFNIATMFSKSITSRVFGRRILSSTRVVDPAKTWASLNWISVPTVRRICRTLGVNPVFDCELLSRYLERAAVDAGFRRRRSAILNSVLRTFDRLGGVALCKRVPPFLQPALSCWIVRDKGFSPLEGETRG